MNIAVLGPKGTFSDGAYLLYDKVYKERNGESLSPVYCSTIDEVFEQVCSNEEVNCELGIVPIENTLDGCVLRTLDLLHEKDAWIIEENLVEVQFSCVANAESVADIKKLYVQFKANGQCRKFINSLNGIEIITTESNMESYYRLGEEEGAAAIIPIHVAEHATNKLIINHVTDSDSNFTRFVVFKKSHFCEEEVSLAKKMIRLSANEEPTKVRIPVYIMPATDRPGILYEILRNFYENKINLITIISRPTKYEMGTYNFYIEIDGKFSRLGIILNALNDIARYNKIKILGIYNE